MRKKRTLSEEHKRKLSLAHKGKTLSAEHIAKLKGRIPWNKGKTNVYSKETLKRMSESQKGIKHNAQSKEKIKHTLKRKYLSGELVPWSKGKKQVFSEETRQEWSRKRKDKPHSEKHRIAMSNAWTSIKRKKRSELIKNLWQNNEYREKQHKQRCSEENCERFSKLMSSDEVRKKSLLGSHKRPTSAEKSFMMFTQKYDLPYKYVGNGSFIIAGKNPDFIHSNGKKNVIEIYGAYWHNIEDGINRVNYFYDHGYRTLIIWDWELGNEAKILEKVSEFNKGENLMYDFVWKDLIRENLLHEDENGVITITKKGSNLIQVVV